ncbi:hopanoid biosynthesis-associated protein HpnK [Rhizosaccharibacter radicis]|uniref:Hopanoid biosynthesis-associated protein HpnK n=1 Tax=Rhizosaccharibacter radicis TaxID=2782605 RepID=A0ABT1W089_9PROT|nr:hopanoid biosynthesis-associated protein HpnK [Acetobacteraceae bacterium KSS12]
MTSIPAGTVPRRALFSADDFGFSEAVNEGIERAHREGLLSTASLMVAGAAAADAVRRARRMPQLRVGLHLVAVEGAPVLPAADIPLLAGPDGWFPSDQARLGVRYFFHPTARRQLLREIEAQFRAFAATGLPLDHANAHKHMHLHPTVGAMLIRAGLPHGLRAVRVPCEPPTPLGEPDDAGARLLRGWTPLLRRQVRRAGLRCNDHCFGLRWSGHMTAARVAALLPRLPPGFSEIYFHPAAARDPLLDRLMPTYEHEGEMDALCSAEVRRALDRAGIVSAHWADAPRA